jgi:Fe2+ transport system protein A
MRRTNMKLTDSKADMQGKILSVGGEDHFMNRITSIGITEGTRFQTVRNDKKMPVLIYLRETLISLNRADAERIEVEKI